MCALTLSEKFFTRLGFELVDRWSISPKVWQACIYCPKFHRCDEVAVLMRLAQPQRKAAARPERHGLEFAHALWRMASPAPGLQQKEEEE